MIESILASIAIGISIISLILTQRTNKKVENFTKKEKLIQIRKQLFELAERFDAHIDKDTIMKLNDKDHEKAKDFFLQSSIILREIRFLYEHNKYYLSAETVKYLDHRLKEFTAPEEDDGQITKMIDFVQCFYKELDKELEELSIIK